MTSPALPLLLEAVTTGAVTVKYGRIAGRCGYVDRVTRTIVLNPDADPEQLAAELAYDLAALVDVHDPAPPRPHLRVLPGDRGHDDDEAAGAPVRHVSARGTPPVLRVAE